MSEQYLIDGYNVIHALGMIQRSAKEGELERSRQRLLDFLANAFGADTARVTIVFDAQQAPRGVPRQDAHRGLRLDFAPKTQSADDRIEELIATSTDPRRLIVVSNDIRLKTSARRRGAQAWGHEDLLDHFEKKRSATSESVAPDEKPGTSDEGERKRWLEEFGGMESDAELRDNFDHDRFN